MNRMKNDLYHLVIVAFDRVLGLAIVCWGDLGSIQWAVMQRGRRLSRIVEG